MADSAPDEVEVIRAGGLAGIPHGFLGRRGGVSRGTIAGLNVGHGAQDDSEAVAENRRRAVEAVLPGAALATVHQVHSPDTVIVELAVMCEPAVVTESCCAAFMVPVSV